MIPIVKPLLDQQDVDAAAEAILSGWVTQGPQVLAFEQEFAQFIGSKYACAVSNCTAALQMALSAVGVGLGDVVLTVSHSFIATANAVRACGAEPVFIDVTKGGFNLDPTMLDSCLKNQCELRDNKLFYRNISAIAAGESPLAALMSFSPSGLDRIGRVAAILCVDQIGIPCDLSRVVEIAEKYHLPLVEDAACAVGSEYLDRITGQWRKVGNAEKAVACFSFHARKLLTTGDGGMITTEDPKLDQQFRLLRHHGMSISDLLRHGSGQPLIESYQTTGFNYRLTDIQAAIGRSQLKKLPAQIVERQRLAIYYQQLLSPTPWLKCYQPLPEEKLNWQSFPIILQPSAPITRDELLAHLQQNSIAARPGIMNAHCEAPYLPQAWKLENSELMRANTVILPLYSGLLDQDVLRIVETIAGIAK